MSHSKHRPVIGNKTGPKVIQSKNVTEEYLAHEMSRRNMLRAALAGAAAAVGGSALAGCGNNPGPMDSMMMGDAGGDTNMMPDVVDAAPRMLHLVGAGSHDTDHGAAVTAALNEAIDLRATIHRGDRVYVRVNTNSGDMYPFSTSVDTLRQIGGMLRDIGADFFIGDRSFYGDSARSGGGTMRNFEANGIADVARELGVTLQVFGDMGAGDSAAEQVNWVDLPAMVDPIGPRPWSGTMRIPEMVSTARHIISVGCMKTHFIATFTMSMKLIIGLINPVDRARTGNLDAHANVHSKIAYMCKAGPTPTLNIVDGWEAVITGGPNQLMSGVMSRTGEPHVVVASRDRVAADVFALSVLRTVSPMTEAIRRTTIWRNPQVVAAVRAQVGVTDAAGMDVSGPTVPPDRMMGFMADIMAG